MSAFDPEFCPTCGTSLVPRQFDGRERAYCPNCDEHVFHLPSPAAGVAVVRGEAILLVHRTGPQYGGTWAIPGGLVEWDEEPREAAVRELTEEAGVEVPREGLTLLDATRLEGPRGEFSAIKLNYAVSHARTSGVPAPGEEVRAARFWTLGEMDGSDEELRPGERRRVQRALEWAAGRR